MNELWHIHKKIDMALKHELCKKFHLYEVQKLAKW